MGLERLSRASVERLQHTTAKSFADPSRPVKMSLWWIRHGTSVKFVLSIGLAVVAGQLITDELKLHYMVQ